jgi:predicted hydrocarbon binding protein
MVGIPRGVLTLLRETLLREGGPAAASFLQEAGYAGGESLTTGFQSWLLDHGHGDMSALHVNAFAGFVSEYFRELGWGSIQIARVNDAVAAIDTSDWWEADPTAQMDHPGCHISTGLLADLLGRISGQALAVLEVECRSMGSQHCRFLTGSAEALVRVYVRMVRGVGYRDAVDALVD